MIVYYDTVIHKLFLALVKEYFTMYFKETKSGADLIMAWDYFEAVLPISF